jgi:hypothetical protein
MKLKWEHWDLPNTEIFQSKDVASGNIVVQTYYERIFCMQMA